MSKKIFFSMILLVLAGAAGVVFSLFILKDNNQSNDLVNSIKSTVSEATGIDVNKNSDPEPLVRVANEDKMNDPNGPFYHQVYSAVSTDGLNWTTDGKMLFDHASVPGAVITGDNTIFVYFVDGTSSVKNGPAVAKSTDLGQTWTEYATVFSNPLSDKFCGADPEVELLDDETIRLYLICFPMSKISNQSKQKVQSQVISALSTDGINFTIEDGQRVLSQSGETLTDSDVIKIGDLWKMYISSGPKVVSLTSNDGLTFTRDDGFRNTTGAVTGSYLINENLARHYYCAQDGIRSATSSGGEWTTESGIRIAMGENKMVCDPTIIKLPDGTYKMFYKIQP